MVGVKGILAEKGGKIVLKVPEGKPFPQKVAI